MAVAVAGIAHGGLSSRDTCDCCQGAHTGPLVDAHTHAQPCSAVRLCLRVQVYAASIMFGYFLRRVDKRFQLESALGMIDMPADTEEAVARLERLFAQVGLVVGPRV